MCRLAAMAYHVPERGSQSIRYYGAHEFVEKMLQHWILLANVNPGDYSVRTTRS